MLSVRKKHLQDIDAVINRFSLKFEEFQTVAEWKKNTQKSHHTNHKLSSQFLMLIEKRLELLNSIDNRDPQYRPRNPLAQKLKQAWPTEDAKKCGKTPPLPSPRKRAPIILTVSPKSKRTEASRASKGKK